MIHLLVTFLLSSQLFQQTNSEWVEISQQHYRRKPEDFFETPTRKAAVFSGADLSSAIIKAPVLESDKEVSAHKGAVLSISNGVTDSRPKKGNVYKITNVGSVEKGHQYVTNIKDSDELNFTSEDEKDITISDSNKGVTEKETNAHRKLNPTSQNRFSSKGHASLSPSGNKIVRLTSSKNVHGDNLHAPGNINIINSENIKKLSSTNYQNRKPTQDISGQRYESYEIKDDEKNKYALKTKGAQENLATNTKTKDRIVLHNLEDLIPQLTTPRTFTTTTAPLGDVFNVQTEEYPYFDVIHDFDEIPNKRVDLIDSDTYKVEADEISDVKLIVRKPTQKNKQENIRASNAKEKTELTDDKTSFKKVNHIISYKNSDLNDNADQLESSEIKNDKIPFERLDITKIAEPPDPGFITKHDLIEEGFIINENEPENSGSLEGIEESETYVDDVTVTTEKTNYEQVQENDTSINSTKLNPIENVMKVVKYVTETISKNTRKGFKSKINYLNRLKNSLMNNIVSRIEALWPDDDARRHRTARQARSHVEFPSSEGALMSISFLTFAVFLIKLVMQLIQTFRNNNPQFLAPGAVLVNRAASGITKRAGRLTGD